MDFYYINFFHVLFTLLIVHYPVLVKTNYYYDFVYILFMFALLYSYILLNGECFVSYFIKKYKNPAYKAGTDVSVNDEYKSVLFNSDTIAKYLIYYILVAMIISGFVVLRRHRFLQPIFVYLFSGLLLLYFVLLRMAANKVFEKFFNVGFFGYITFLLYKLLSYHKLI